MTAQPPPGIALPLQAAIGANEDEAYYVYGVVPWPLDIDLAQPVYFLPFQDVAAIVRRVTLTEFGPAALETNLRDIRWMEAAVLAHQQVLDHIMERGGWRVEGEASSALHASRSTLHAARPTPVPMKFCTIYRSEEGVRQALAGHHAELAAALARLAGKREWGVKMYCDGATLHRQIEDPHQGVALRSEQIRTLQAQMAGLSEGAAYFVKKKFETALAEEVESLCDEYAQRSHGCLAAFAVEDPARGAEAVANAPQDQRITGRPEVMILNGAYLVADERLEAFQAELARLAAEYSPLGFSCELTGPWAPYNFVEDPTSARSTSPGLLTGDPGSTGAREVANEPIRRG